MKDYRKYIEQWRETGNGLIAKDPDDRAGQALVKCANDLEFEMSTKRGLAATMAIIFTATALMAEAARDLEERYQDRSMYTTTTLVPPRDMQFEQPVVPAAHIPEDRGGETIFLVSPLSASGSNVTSVVSSYVFPSAGNVRIVKKG